MTRVPALPGDHVLGEQLHLLLLSFMHLKTAIVPLLRLTRLLQRFQMGGDSLSIYLTSGKRERKKESGTLLIP